MDGAGYPFSGLQAIDRNGTGVVLESGSGALRVQASSKELRPERLGHTIRICSCRSVQAPL